MPEELGFLKYLKLAKVIIYVQNIILSIVYYSSTYVHTLSYCVIKPAACQPQAGTHCMVGGIQ